MEKNESKNSASLRLSFWCSFSIYDIGSPPQAEILYQEQETRGPVKTCSAFEKFALKPVDALLSYRYSFALHRLFIVDTTRHRTPLSHLCFINVLISIAAFIIVPVSGDCLRVQGLSLVLSTLQS